VLYQIVSKYLDTRTLLEELQQLREGYTRVSSVQLRAAFSWLHIVGEVVWCGEPGRVDDPTWLCSKGTR
jgi:hypothetical protein